MSDGALTKEDLLAELDASERRAADGRLTRLGQKADRAGYAFVQKVLQGTEADLDQLTDWRVTEDDDRKVELEFRYLGIYITADVSGENRWHFREAFHGTRISDRLDVARLLAAQVT